jgi:uncharacterized protein involved in high-affinity Fe2+ transport
MGIEMFPQVAILGMRFGHNIYMTMQEGWTRVTNAVRAPERTAYDRNLCLAHRVQYVQMYLLAKTWYLAQLLPPIIGHI